MKSLYAFRLALFAIAVAAVSACGESKLGPNVPASVSPASGDSQTILVGNHSSAPLIAVIKNSDGSPLPNIPVRWTVTSGGGSLLTLIDTTNANGEVSTTYLSPAVAGPAKVNAAASGRSTAFLITLAPDTVGTLIAFEGDGAAALVGFQLALVAKASDRFGNAIKGVDITWATNGGTLQLPTGVTDSLGRASNTITVGPDTGKVAITAASRFNTITFTVHSLPTN
ncbi:MAG TPA: Ig-like domain-containing protein [Gemmatimonadaceae bacterium]|nr:Ig-like domain-containing protein [Gemmatimonadaceae bacterium]